MAPLVSMNPHLSPILTHANPSENDPGAVELWVNDNVASFSINESLSCHRFLRALVLLKTTRRRRTVG